MSELIQFTQELGRLSIDLLWWPLLLWTGLALITGLVLKYASRLSAAYHYHLRIAVLSALPAGIISAAALNALNQSIEGTVNTALFVVQNPIAVSASSIAHAGFHWSDPSFWIGIATLLSGLIALAALAKLTFNFIQLKIFTAGLKDEADRYREEHSDIDIFISDDTEVPFTFGWIEKKIVIPAKLKDEPQKYRMALRHELTHVQNRDYMINSFTQSLKALFFFHPLVHHFINKANEYREIYCDLNVLTDTRISQKRYAKLLYELSSKKLFKQQTAVNMAVNPSTLKKRIQIMKKQTNIAPSFKQSIIATLLLGLALTGFMACSDITSDGLTTSEVKEFQQKAAEAPNLSGESAPLWVINGEIITDKDIIGRIKVKYIKSINVLKNQKAITEYGKTGKNGVIEIKVYNKEKALTDLLEQPRSNHEGPPPPPVPNKIYLAAQDMPQLKNQKAFYTNLTYPEECKQLETGGTIYVQFIVTKTGDTTNFRVVRGINDKCDQAIVQYVKTHAKFTPGTQNGQPVNVRMTLPITLKLK